MHGEFHKDPEHPEQHREKMTDVRMAIAAVRDAALRHDAPRQSRREYDPLRNTKDIGCPCDAILLVSADLDFLPAAEMVAHEFGKETAVFFPLFSKAAHDRSSPGVMFRQVSIEDLRACFLGDVPTPDGRMLRWNDYKTSVVQSMGAGR